MSNRKAEIITSDDARAVKHEQINRVNLIGYIHMPSKYSSTLATYNSKRLNHISNAVGYKDGKVSSRIKASDRSRFREKKA